MTLSETHAATLQARCLHSLQRNSCGKATGRSWKPRRSGPSDRRPSDIPPDEEVATAGSKSNSCCAGPFAGPKPEPMTVPRGASRSNRRAHSSRHGWARGFLPSWSCEFDSRHPLKATSLVRAAFAMPPCAFNGAHWARAITWAHSFWAIDRPSEPQLSSLLERDWPSAARIGDRVQNPYRSPWPNFL